MVTVPVIPASLSLFSIHDFAVAFFTIIVIPYGTEENIFLNDSISCVYNIILRICSVYSKFLSLRYSNPQYGTRTLGTLIPSGV